MAPRELSLSDRRLCTAEVRGSNPLGSTQKNKVLQGKREASISALNAGGLRNSATFTRVVCSALLGLTALRASSILQRIGQVVSYCDLPFGGSPQCC
jgi:hypothetical protein